MLGGLGLHNKYITLIDTLGTATELITLPLFALIVGFLGLRRAFLLGIGAWIVRYAVFFVGQPLWFVIGSFMFHGICFAFVYVVAQLYVDGAAQRDIRASAQSLLNAVVMGVGPFFGSYLCGYAVHTFGGNYKAVFMLSMIGSLGAGIVFVVAFKQKKPEADPDVEGDGEPAVP